MANSKSKLKYPDRKISDTFLQLAEPWLDAFGPNATEAQMEPPLKIAWTVWNAVVYSDVAKKSSTLDLLRSSMDSDPESMELVEALIDRKRLLFDDDHRLIGEYKLFRKGGEFRLRAEARDPRGGDFGRRAFRVYFLADNGLRNAVRWPEGLFLDFMAMSPRHSERPANPAKF